MVKFERPSCKDLILETLEMEEEEEEEQEEEEIEVEDVGTGTGEANGHTVSDDTTIGGGIVEEGKTALEDGGEGAIGTALEAHEHMENVNAIADEAKETKAEYDEMTAEKQSVFEQLKAKGYKNVSTTSSVWEVDFTSMPFDHDERAAVVHIVYDMMMKYNINNECPA